MSTSLAEIIRIRVPGTTSNFGPGFDCLGAALQLCNELELRPTGDAVVPAHPMVQEVVDCFYAQPELLDVERIGFEWSISGEVPISRGLGSSVTLRLGLLKGLNEAHGQPLSRERLFQVCTYLEGHPDNAGPAVFGGFFVGGQNGSFFNFPIEPRLKFVILIRALEVETNAARKVLPESITRKEAVENVGNAASIVAAFATGHYESLSGLFRDHLHQPHREAVNPGLSSIIAAGEAAGAVGGFLSGSGSCIACLTTGEDGEAIGQAMKAACSDAKEPEIRVVAADNKGSRRVAINPQPPAA